MVTTKNAINALLKHKRKMYKMPVVYNPSNKDSFAIYSYANYCIDEMIKRLEENEELPFKTSPIDVLENFKKELDFYACSAKTEVSKVIFSTMYDTSIEMIDILITHCQ